MADRPEHAATQARLRSRLEAWMRRQGDAGDKTEREAKDHQGGGRKAQSRVPAPPPETRGPAAFHGPDNGALRRVPRGARPGCARQRRQKPIPGPIVRPEPPVKDDETGACRILDV